MTTSRQRELTVHARAALLRSGWAPQRAASNAVPSWQRELAQSGCDVFPEARRILEAFGGLRLLREGAVRESLHLVEAIFFDPTAVPIDRSFLEAMAIALGTPLCPIGALTPTNTPIAVGADRRIFLLTKPALFIGGNIEAAIDALALGKPFTAAFTPEDMPGDVSVSGSASSEAFIAYRCDEGATRFYSIEDRVSHVAVIRVSQLQRKGRTLTVHYEPLRAGMPAKRAADIIQRCLLLEFHRNAFAPLVAEVCYVDTKTKRRLQLAYASPG